MDDLATWLKAAAENKINTKNTWKSTLIDHFSDLSKFEEKNGINFQKASSTLDGCIKVYATRVDDVAADATKLLGAFGQEKEQKKKTKKRLTFVEKDTANINLKVRDTPRFKDPIFSPILYEPNFTFLINSLPHQPSGLLTYKDTEPITDEILINKEKDDFEMELRPVNPSLRSINKEPGEWLDAEVPEPQNCSFDENFALEPEYCNEESDGVPEPQDPPVLQETPFGYFKGWAGPATWRTGLASRTGARTTERKPREQFLIDFMQEKFVKNLFEEGDITMSKEIIVERRRNKNILPDDMCYERSDLYKFFICPGYFGGNKSVVLAEEPASAPDLSVQLGEVCVLNEEKIEIKHSTATKKVDIKRLKESILDCLGREKRRVSEIIQEMPVYYGEREIKGISVHQCIVSLLYLANEKEIELVAQSGDVIVKP